MTHPNPDIPVLLNICPASIWLLGSVANCAKPGGHDGPHQIVIQWTTDGELP